LIPKISIQKEEVDRILDTLSLLPDDQAEVIRLRYLGQLETKEIASALGKTEVNIRKIESRALTRLRELLR
jgi:RNA polymerase sigma factor (sigma-70 family)